MGIEQIRMNQTKALPPVLQFNWSQMESNRAKFCGSLTASAKIRKRGWRGIDVESEKKITPPKTQVPKGGTWGTRQFNWSQMESTTLNRTIPCADAS
jgi:hypothetical protein